jgi:DNA-binding CsgD family transcriptional regulator
LAFYDFLLDKLGTPSNYAGMEGGHVRKAYRLTARELEVLGLIAHGKTARGVANELSISLETVRAHVKSIYATLGAHNKDEATAWYWLNIPHNG